MKSLILLSALCLPSLAYADADNCLVDHLERQWDILRSELEIARCAHAPQLRCDRTCDRRHVISKIRDFKRLLDTTMRCVDTSSTGEQLLVNELITLIMGISIALVSDMQKSSYGFGVGCGFMLASWIGFIQALPLVNPKRQEISRNRLVELQQVVQRFCTAACIQ